MAAEEVKFSAAEKEPYKVIRFDSAGNYNGVVFGTNSSSYHGLKLSVNAEKFDDLVEFLEENEISYYIQKEHLRKDANRSVENPSKMRTKRKPSKRTVRNLTPKEVSRNG